MSDHHITAHDQIHYLIPVPHPLGSCAFQGFSRGILEVSFFLRYIARMPSSMRNFQEPKSVLRAQRAAGLDFYDVHFVPVQQLAELRVRTPFAVIFSEQSTVRDVMAWLAATPSAQLLHVSCVDEKGVLHIRHFNRRTLRRHCIESLRRLIASGNDKFQSALDALSPSTPLRRRPLPFPQRYHNTVVPNEITLFSAGMQFLQTKPFIPSTDDSECTSAIAASAEKILALRSNSNLSIAGRTPSLILTTAGLSREIVKEWQSKRHFKDPALEMTQLGIRIMQSQRGYFHRV